MLPKPDIFKSYRHLSPVGLYVGPGATATMTRLPFRPSRDVSRAVWADEEAEIASLQKPPYTRFHGQFETPEGAMRRRIRRPSSDATGWAMSNVERRWA